MKVTIATPTGKVTYLGVEDFEGITSEEGDWRLYSSRQADFEHEDVSGNLVSAVDSTAMPETIAAVEGGTVYDWRPNGTVRTEV